MAINLSSPSRRRVGGGAVPNHDDIVERPVEEMKDALKEHDRQASPARIGFSEKVFVDNEGGPGHVIKVLSPARPSPSIHSTGVDICFHKLSLTATYVSKQMNRKTRRILKGKESHMSLPVSALLACALG